jgi:hypothetical protein
MTTQCCKSPAKQVPGSFECLARVMQKNFIRQYDFAVLLRLLSSQFSPRSIESHTLRIASRTARNKGTKLRNLLTDLGWNPAKPKHKRLAFLLWFHLVKSSSPRLMILSLRLVTGKRLRGRLLDEFCPWNSTQQNEVKCLAPSSPDRNTGNKIKNVNRVHHSAECSAHCNNASSQWSSLT